MRGSEAIFVDTWGWMALGHHRDPHHREVRCIYQELRRQQLPIYTSDYVLDEVITLLFRREVFREAVRFVEGLFAAAALGHLRVERDGPLGREQLMDQTVDLLGIIAGIPHYDPNQFLPPAGRQQAPQTDQQAGHTAHLGLLGCSQVGGQDQPLGLTTRWSFQP